MIGRSTPVHGTVYNCTVQVQQLFHAQSTPQSLFIFVDAVNDNCDRPGASGISFSRLPRPDSFYCTFAATRACAQLIISRSHPVKAHTVLFAIKILQHATSKSHGRLGYCLGARGAAPWLLYSYPLSFSWHSHYTTG